MSHNYVIMYNPLYILVLLISLYDNLDYIIMNYLNLNVLIKIFICVVEELNNLDLLARNYSHKFKIFT